MYIIYVYVYIYMLGHTQMEASMNGGTPKWVVFTENPIKFDDLGVPVCQENPIVT